MADDPLDLLAWTMLGEAANQGPDGMAAVAHVALNRAKSGKYAPDLASVLLQDKQFSAWNAGQGGNDPKGRYPKSSPEFQRAKAIAQQVIQGDISDKTGGALNYHTTDVSPGWAARLSANADPVTIGAHQFYPPANVMKANLPKAETPFSKKGEQYAPAIVWNGRDANLTPEVVAVLNRTQELVDFPLVVNSGYRSPQRNAAANGAKGSQHLHGNAIDISLKGLTDDQRTQLTRALAQTGARRLIAYSGNSVLHFDMAKGFPAQKGFSTYAMFDKSARNMGSAHRWFIAGLDGGKIPPRNIPQVGTALDVVPAPQPAALTPPMMQKRGQLPPGTITLVPNRRSDKNNLNFPKTEQKNSEQLYQPPNYFRRPPQSTPKADARPIMTASLKNPGALTRIASLEPSQSFAGQDRVTPQATTKTIMVPNPAYVAPRTAAPGAGVTEAQMRAIRGDLSVLPPKAPVPVVPQFIPKTITVPAPQYAALKPPPPKPQGQQKGLFGNLMGMLPQIDVEQIKQNVTRTLGPTMLGSVAGRTAMMNVLMRRNVGQAPTATPGWTEGATRVLAINNRGSAPVTLMRAASGPGGEASRAFDAKVHAGQNMDVYRANRAAVGGPITQQSIERAIQSGKTLFKAR